MLTYICCASVTIKKKMPKFLAYKILKYYEPEIFNIKYDVYFADIYEKYDICILDKHIIKSGFPELATDCPRNTLLAMRHGHDLDNKHLEKISISKLLENVCKSGNSQLILKYANPNSVRYNATMVEHFVRNFGSGAVYRSMLVMDSFKGYVTGLAFTGEFKNAEQYKERFSDQILIGYCGGGHFEQFMKNISLLSSLCLGDCVKYACKYKHKNILAKLVEHDPVVLTFALEKSLKHLGLLKFLLKNTPNIKQETLDSLLCTAVKYYNLHVVKYLIKKGAKITDITLWYAGCAKNLDILKLIVGNSLATQWKMALENAQLMNRKKNFEYLIKL